MATNNILEAALHLASKGWRVFPVNRKKKPLANSNGCKDATTDEDQIRKWFEVDRGWQLAVATGIDLLVLDLDCKNGHDGVASLHTLEAKYEELPYGPRVITPTGGQHVWLRVDPSLHIRCSVGVLGDGIDVRAEGGYVVVPTSVIESGAYRWAIDLDDCDPPPAPKWLLDMVCPPAKTNGSGEPYSGGADVRSLLDAVLQPGKWHDSAVRLVGHLVSKRVDPALIMALAPALTLPGWTTSQTRDELQVMADGARAKGWDIPESIIPVSPENSTGWSPMKDIEQTNINWLWPDRLIASRMNLIVGMGDVGKDVLACTLAAVVSTGRAWPDGRDLGRGPGMVGYVSDEDEASDTLGPRLSAAGADLSRVFRWKSSNPPSPADIANLDMLIVSPLIYILGDGDTNSDRDSRSMIRPWRDAAEKFGTSIIGICHYNKKNDLAAVQRILGSVGMVNFVRSIWAIERDPDDKGRRLMLRLKGNLMRDEEDAGLAFRIEHIGPLSQSIVCVWEKDGVGITADEVHDKKRNGGDGKKSKVDECAEWLLTFLHFDGPQNAKHIILCAGIDGHQRTTLYQAKSKLGDRIVVENRGNERLWSVNNAK